VLVHTTKEEKYGWMLADWYREASGGAGLIDLQPALADGSHLAEHHGSSTIRTGLPVASSRSARAWLAEAKNSRKPGWALSGIGGPGTRCRQAQGSQRDEKPPAGSEG